MASIISAGTTSATALNMSADTSGVLQLASNNGTVALTVATNQRVTIGTAAGTPVNLNIGGGVGGTSAGIALNPNASSGTYAYWTADATNQYLASSIGSTGVKFTLNLSAPDSSMTIDSSGRVLTPSQTAFYVYANGADTYSGSGWSKMRLATYGAPTNEFNTSLINFTTNQFTAPVAGKYFFSAAVTMTGSTNTDGTIGFTLNGASNPAGGRSTAYASGTGLGGMDCVNVLNLAAGDTVSVYFYQSGSQTTRNTQYAGYFCGYLLG